MYCCHARIVFRSAVKKGVGERKPSLRKSWLMIISRTEAIILFSLQECLHMRYLLIFLFFGVFLSRSISKFTSLLLPPKSVQALVPTYRPDKRCCLTF